MDLRKLRHAQALAEWGSYRRAAEAVHLSQPALSRSIQALEHELGLRLFERDASGASPTAAGRQLLSMASPLLGAWRRLEQCSAELRDGVAGELSLGAGPLPAATLLPPVLASLQHERPGLAISLRIAHAEELRVQLEAEQIEAFVADISALQAEEVGAARGPGHARRALAVRPLGRQHGGLFCRAGHALAGRPRLALDDLHGQRFAAVQLPPALQLALRRLSGDPDRPLPPPGLNCDNVLLLKDMVLRSDLVLACTREAVADELASGQLVALDVTGLTPVTVSIGLVTLRGRSPTAAASRFAELLDSHA